jgi:hypothetical protein
MRLGASEVPRSEKCTNCLLPEISPKITSIHNHIPRKEKIREIIKMKSIIGIKTTLSPSRRFILSSMLIFARKSKSND